MNHISFDPKKAMHYEEYAHKMIKISQEKMDHNKLDARVKLQHGYIDTLPQSEEDGTAILIFVL